MISNKTKECIVKALCDFQQHTNVDPEQITKLLNDLTEIVGNNSYKQTVMGLKSYWIEEMEKRNGI